MNKRALMIILGVVAIAMVLAWLAYPGEENGLAENTATLSAPTLEVDDFPEIPAEARIATQTGDPRPPAYWKLWNSCAPDNRADAAEANGGREAGWFLMDDLLADPGIEIGDFAVVTCEQGLALLEGHSTDGETTSDSVYQLASQLLAAELNLTLGAENCPVAEEAVVGAHIILSDLGFDGSGEYASNLSAEMANSVDVLLEYLEGYNRGELCIN